MTSDEDEENNLTPMFCNRAQNTSHIPQRRHHPIQVCRQPQPITDTAASPPPEDQGEEDIFRPYDLPSSSTTRAHNSLPNVSTVADALQP